MSKLKKISLFVLLIFIINSCATTANYTEVVKSWMGSDVNNLITSWGPPSDTFVMPNGNKMYTWLYTNNSLVTTNYNQYTKQLQSRQIQWWCKTTFTTDQNNKIIDWRWEGNSCRSVKKQIYGIQSKGLTTIVCFVTLD